MKLVGSLTSPYVRKVRVTFLEKKIDLELVIDGVWTPDTILNSINPLGKVPTLLLDDGSSLYDSRVIVEYADAISPVGKLIPATGREKASIKTWEALSDGVLDALILTRLERTWGPRKGVVCEPWVERQLGKVDAGLKQMSVGLGQNTWFFDNHFSLADIAVGVTLAYTSFRFPEIEWATTYPNLSEFYKRISQRNSFIDTEFPKT
jgi:glutathione S-transferase